MERYPTSDKGNGDGARGLRLAQRREVDGLIARWTTHELEEVLTATLIQSLLALVRLPADNVAFAHVKKVNRGVECGSILAQRLLARIQMPPIEMEELDLNELCRDCAELWEAWAPAPIRLELDLSPELPPVCGDRQRLRQVVLNLLVNATEAVAAGHFSGRERNTIRLVTRPLHLNERSQFTFGSHEPLDGGEYACLEVRDRGPSLDETALARLFEPGLAGWSRGRGCGLGLCLQIVREHRGGVQVRREGQEYTVFRFCLPAHNPEETFAARRPYRQQPVTLHVEDDPGIRHAVADLLDLVEVERDVAVKGLEGLSFPASGDPLSGGEPDLNLMKSDEVEGHLRQVKQVPAQSVSSMGSKRKGGL